MKEKRTNKPIHLSWIIVILILAIISIISYRASDNTEILNFISFAATLSSIILSIIAIVYTFVTSNSSNSINENLIGISNKLYDQTDDLNNIYLRIAEITNTIPEKVSSFNKSIDETGKLLALSIDNATKQKTGVLVNAESISANTPIVMSFLFYIFNLIDKNNKAIDLDKVVDVISTNYKKLDGNQEYLHGVLKCLRSTGVIYFESTDTVFYNFDFYDNKAILFSKEKVIENLINKTREFPQETIDHWENQISNLLDSFDKSFI